MAFYGGNDFVIQKSKVDAQVDIQPLMRNVYMWMGLGLLVTAFMAMFISSSPAIQGLLLENPAIWLIAIVAQLGLVMGLSFGIRKMSATVAGVMFFVYSAVTGVTFSFIFMAYSIGSITAAFVSTAALFGAMTVFAFTTSIDLTQYRSYFMMGLVGLLIAMIVNIFIGSGPFDFLISAFGVILFTGLTAYDTQRIAQLAADPEMQTHNENMLKMSVLGALTLYLDFINLFLFLLRLFGSSRD